MNRTPSRLHLRTLVASVATVLATLVPQVAKAQAFTYDPPGKLVPTRSGQGRVDTKIYAPTMRFPMEQPKAFANSQVYGNGGGQGTGGQCDAVNYSYPWHDNFCESRSYSMPLCPAGTGHQGQDIRPPTCVKDTHWVVAVEDGTITSIGSYSVYLTTADGTRFDYLHMSTLQVKVGDKVTKGQRIGKVSNQFDGTPTTIHLHFNIRQAVGTLGAVYVPPYMSLIESYKRANGLPTDAGVPDAGPKSDAATQDASKDTGTVDPQPVVPDPGGDQLPTPEGEAAVNEAPVADEQGCNGSGATPSLATAGLGFVGVLAALRRRRERSRLP